MTSSKAETFHWPGMINALRQSNSERKLWLTNKTIARCPGYQRAETLAKIEFLIEMPTANSGRQRQPPGPRLESVS